MQLNTSLNLPKKCVQGICHSVHELGKLKHNETYWPISNYSSCILVNLFNKTKSLPIFLLLLLSGILLFLSEIFADDVSVSGVHDNNLDGDNSKVEGVHPQPHIVGLTGTTFCSPCNKNNREFLDTYKFLNNEILNNLCNNEQL